MVKKIRLTDIPFLFVKVIDILFSYFANLHYRKIADLHPDAKILSMGKIINAKNSYDCIKVGKNTLVKGELLLFGHGGIIEIGEDCYIGENSRIWSAIKIKIGNRVLISHNVNIHDTDGHPIDADARHKHFQQISTTGHPRSNVDIVSEPIHIEDDAWIGFNATILKGVTIGKGAIIGASSVVTKDVLPYTIVAGNPAKFIRDIHTNEHIKDSRQTQADCTSNIDFVGTN